MHLRACRLPSLATAAALALATKRTLLVKWSRPEHPLESLLESPVLK